MSKKIGRPTVPKTKAKAVLYGARVARDEVLKINRGIEASGQTPSGVIRKALDNVARLVWTRATKWRFEDLHKETVEFRFRVPYQNGIKTHEGLGYFVVYRN